MNVNRVFYLKKEESGASSAAQLVGRDKVVAGLDCQHPFVAHILALRLEVKDLLRGERRGGGNEKLQ